VEESDKQWKPKETNATNLTTTRFKKSNIAQGGGDAKVYIAAKK
jgi:hypothetical protein